MSKTMDRADALSADLRELEDCYEVTIGLEIHSQLATASKLFSGARNEFGGEPNSSVGGVDAGLPGALPSLNRRAVDAAVTAALAVDAEIAEQSRFDRKQYVYPDLPKGYQITQHDEPLCRNGALELEPSDAPGDSRIERRRIGIERLHLEEDAGKSIHRSRAESSSGERGRGRTLVDLNRSGVPLIEIVSEPEMRTPAEAVAYLKELRRTVVQLGISDGEMAEGSLRCDANVSVAFGEAEALSERVELKNINSFKFVKDGLIYEIARHVEGMETGVMVEEATRRYVPKAGRTVRMRSKETEADYRYMPEPDLPVVRVDDTRVSRCREAMVEPPAQRRRRFREVFGLEAEQAAVLCDNRAVAKFAERCFELCRSRESEEPSVAAVATWIEQEVLRVCDPQEGGDRSDVRSAVMSAEYFVDLVAMRTADDVSDNGAREVFEALVEQPADERESPEAVVERLGLRQISDRERLREVVDEVFEQHPEQLEQLRDGDDGLVGWFIGQVMQATGGSADPQVVREMLEDEADTA